MKVLVHCRYLVVAIVLCVLSTVAPTEAQTECLAGLKGSDCELLMAATADFAALATSDVNTDIIIRYSGLPVGGAYIAVKGSSSVDFSKVTDPSIISILTHLAMSGSAKVSVSIGRQHRLLKLDLRVLEGSLYFRPTPIDQWFKLRLTQTLSQNNGSTDVSAMLKIFDPATIQLAGVINADDVAIRVNGPTIDGQATAQITAVWDVVAGYDKLSPAQQEKLQRGFAAAFLTSIVRGSTANPSDPKLMAAAERSLKRSNVLILWVIGLQDKKLHGLGLNLNIPIDPVLATAAYPKLKNVPITVNVRALWTFSKLGQPVTTPAIPDNALDITKLTLSNAGSINTRAKPPRD
jgi:hypothetical protein